MDSNLFLSLYLGYEFGPTEKEVFTSDFLTIVRRVYREAVESGLMPHSLSSEYSVALEGQDVEGILRAFRKEWVKGTFILYQVDSTNGIVETFCLDSKGEVEVDTPFDSEYTTIDMRGGSILVPTADPDLTIDNDLTPYLISQEDLPISKDS